MYASSRPPKDGSIVEKVGELWSMYSYELKAVIKKCLEQDPNFGRRR